MLSNIKLRVDDWRLWCFAIAIFLYGLWGSPTPNNPNWVEVVIALLLILAIGWRDLYQNFRISLDFKSALWRLAAQVFFTVGLFIPLLIGVYKGAPLEVIFRDVVGFVFLCLPLFIVGFFEGKEKRSQAFLYLCIMIAVLFAVRVLVPHFLLFRNTTELLYLANSPLVLMGALYLSSMAGYALFQKISLRSFMKSFIFVVLASLPVMAMFVDLQRASFLALVLSFISLMAIGFVKAPIRMVVPILIIMIVGILIAPYVMSLIEGVSLKTSQVGLNMRTQELLAVWSSLSQSGWSIMFGQGWGSSFASPAVGMLNVTYTHSLLSYVFLKMGLLGFILCLIYLFFIFQKLYILYCRSPICGTAFLWPFLIPIFLYASHKSFDFGLLLSLIIVSCEASRIRKNQGSFST